MTWAEVIAICSSIISPIVVFFLLRHYKRQDFVFSEGQFKIYNSLWTLLCDLERSAEELWENGVTKQNLRNFIIAVNRADRVVRESALLLDQSHFDEMRKIIETLMNYRIGKERLLSLKDVDENAAKEIQQQIEGNFDLLTRYKNLKTEILNLMRRKLSID